MYLAQLFGKYALEPEILNNDSVHKELKMDRDQIRLAKEFNVEWWARHEKCLQESKDAVESLEIAHQFVSGQLGDILTPEQRTRLDQIAVQYRVRVAGEAAGFGHPRILVDAPPTLIRAIRFGEPIEKVFQGQTLAGNGVQLGEPFKEPLVINSPLKVRQSGELHKPVALSIATDKTRNNIARYMLENARRFRLDEDQVARLKAIDEDLPKLRRLLHRELSQLPPPIDGGAARTSLPEVKAVEQFRKSVFEQSFGVLDKRQQSLWGKEIRQRGTIIDD